MVVKALGDVLFSAFWPKNDTLKGATANKGPFQRANSVARYSVPLHCYVKVDGQCCPFMCSTSILGCKMFSVFFQMPLRTLQNVPLYLAL